MSTTLNASTSSGLVQSADTSGTLELQSNGTTQLTVASTGAYGTLKSGTAVASTSGTSIDFTSLPSWVKRITVIFNSISSNGTSAWQVQLGAGSVTTSGYTSNATSTTSGSSASLSSTSGLLIASGVAAAAVHTGSMRINNISGNIWVADSTGTGLDGAAANVSRTGGGVITLGGTLDRVRITTVNGTDTFDAGSINIIYEG